MSIFTFHLIHIENVRNRNIRPNFFGPERDSFHLMRIKTALKLGPWLRPWSLGDTSIDLCMQTDPNERVLCNIHLDLMNLIDKISKWAHSY